MAGLCLQRIKAILSSGEVVEATKEKDGIVHYRTKWVMGDPLSPIVDILTCTKAFVFGSMIEIRYQGIQEIDIVFLDQGKELQYSLELDSGFVISEAVFYDGRIILEHAKRNPIYVADPNDMYSYIFTDKDGTLEGPDAARMISIIKASDTGSAIANSLGHTIIDSGFTDSFFEMLWRYEDRGVHIQYDLFNKYGYIPNRNTLMFHETSTGLDLKEDQLSGGYSYLVKLLLLSSTGYPVVVKSMLGQLHPLLEQEVLKDLCNTQLITLTRNDYTI